MFALSFFLLIFHPSSAQADLTRYDTRYYTIYTDIDPDEVREAAIRMTKMAEEYHERTKGFAGVIHTKFPFYLYRSAADYYAAGGMKGSAGMFMYDATGGKLMAIAGRTPTQQTWHTVQHEGFHQFAHAVIGGEIPTWLNEGLAEYFGESIFTGDGFVTGVIPPWRLERLKHEITAGETKSIRAIMNTSPQEWVSEMNVRNYDQTWSMVHFLVHGDGQKYQQPLADCIRDISKGRSFNQAWKQTMGSDEGFEDRWKTWWLAQGESPTSLLYGKAAVATMTSFVARSYAVKQKFEDFNAFHTAVESDSLRINPDDWLPKSMIVNAMRLYGADPQWEIISTAGKQPIVVYTLADNTRLTGSFILAGTRVDRVNVDVDDMRRILKEAQALLNEGKKEQARSMVQAGLKATPRSALAASARKFLQSCR